MITGVDRTISLIRDDFAYGLWTDIPNRIFYSRAFRNEKSVNGNDEIVAHVYDSGNEYKEVMFDDRWNVSVFFDVDDTRNNVYESATTTLSAIFAVNLNLIYPDATWRQEENAHADVLQVFRESNTAYSIDWPSMNIISGLDAYGIFYRNNVKDYNKHPWHTFRLDFDIKYDHDCNDSQFNRGDDNAYPDPVIIN